VVVLPPNDFAISPLVFLHIPLMVVPLPLIFYQFSGASAILFSLICVALLCSACFLDDSTLLCCTCCCMDLLCCACLVNILRCLLGIGLRCLFSYSSTLLLYESALLYCFVWICLACFRMARLCSALLAS
jgi:hypothetical protein